MDAPVSCFARTPFAGRAFQTPAADLWASCGRAASVTLAALPALGCLPGRSGSLVGQASTASGLAAVLLGAEDQLISRRASQESATVRPASYMACCMPAPRGRQALGWLGSHTALDTLVTPAVHAQLGAPSLCSSGSGQPSEASLASASPRTPRWSLSAGADTCDRPHHRAREMTRGGSLRGGCAARPELLRIHGRRARGQQLPRERARPCARSPHAQQPGRAPRRAELAALVELGSAIAEGGVLQHRARAAGERILGHRASRAGALSTLCASQLPGGDHALACRPVQSTWLQLAAGCEPHWQLIEERREAGRHVLCRPGPVKVWGGRFSVHGPRVHVRWAEFSHRLVNLMHFSWQRHQRWLVQTPLRFCKQPQLADTPL